MTYSQFKNKPSSEKITLAVVEASRRLMGWTLHSGSVYYIPESAGVLVSVKENATAYTEVDSLASVIASTYFYDRANGRIYLQASDSSNPNSKFLSLKFKLFFSSAPLTLPHDLDEGFEVYWEPSIKSTSRFGVEIDTVNQAGEAIEGSGTLTLHNDQSFWQPRFDKYYFENHLVQIYSYNRDLEPSEAKLLFKGKIESKSYSQTQVSFKMRDMLAELRAPLGLADLQDASSIRIPESLNNAKQRMIIGRVEGLRPVNIDQVLTGYPLTGTVAITSASPNITGTGTQFLKELSPDDRVVISGQTYSVASVTSDTAAVLTENYTGIDLTATSITVVPDKPKRWINREWLIAGHALREPLVTVTEQVAEVDRVKVSTTIDINVGDTLYIGTLGAGELKVVSQVIPGSGIIKFTSTFASARTVGTEVRRPCVQNVRINDISLTYYRDYQVDASTARLTLSEDAEKNAAPIREMGNLTFTDTSRTVTGSGFEALLKPGDIVRAKGEADWFEVLSIESDTSLTLRTAATYTGTATGQYKNFVFKEGEDVLTVDVLGRTEQGTTSGDFVENAPHAVRVLLADAGLTSIVNTDSFDDAEELAYAPIGLVYPATFSGQTEPTYRDVINRINKSAFGSLIQDEDFKLKYVVLSPDKPASTLRLREEDCLSISIQSTNTNIVQRVLVNYAPLEYYYLTGEPYTKYLEATSDTANFILETGRQKDLETVLVNQSDAEIYAKRWAFLLEQATATLKIGTKLQAVDLEVGSIIDVEHEKLYERFGGTSRRMLCLVEKVTKNGDSVEIEAVNLSNAFNRTSTWTDSSLAYEDSSEDRKIYDGYWTDQYGLIDNNPDTFGSKVWW